MAHTSMQEEIQDKELKNALEQAETLLQSSPASREDLLRIRKFFTDRQEGVISRLRAYLKTVPPDQKASIGRLLNDLRRRYESWYERFRHLLNEDLQRLHIPDPTLPGIPRGTLPARRHPVTDTLLWICECFEEMGFRVASGPEIETDWYNFTALNIPEDHPAREMQDTFYIQEHPPILLRTHTSPVQIRVLERGHLPVRMIAPGRVYRNETVSARAHVQFHQVEGLYVDRNVSVADLKGTLNHFARRMFGNSVRTRFRISFFPFTEPSFEMDISCTLCAGKGCRLCKHTGWVEILGCGMVDPAVFQAVSISPEEWRGFAFGIGVERITMLLYQLEDIRTLFQARSDVLTILSTIVR